MNFSDDFRSQMVQAGLDYTKPIINDGKIHRFKSAGDHGKNCWYLLYPGSPSVGVFGCWKRGIKETWCDRSRKLSQDDWTEVRRQWKEAQLAQERERAELNARAAKATEDIMRRSPCATADHPYLRRKGIAVIGSLGIRYGDLLVPLHDIHGQLCSLQFINADGAKKFLTGGRVLGCFSPIGNQLTGPLVICEGFATGASIHQATRLPVVCAMNCHNLLPVAKAFRAKFPRREIIIAGDNDAFTVDIKKGPWNPGLEAAGVAAKTIGARLALPQFKTTSTKPTDFNDLHLLEGINTVKAQIENASTPTETDDQTMARLASLPPLEYERARLAEAARLGIRIVALDAEMEKRRPKKEEPSNIMEPWPDSVNGGDLGNGLAGEFGKFLVLPKHADTILTLWTLHTYSWEQCEYSPILAITSPVRSCGKSRVLDVLEKLVHDYFRTGNMSEAVLFRVLDSLKPSVLIDEFDTIPEERRDALANILKHGFHRAGCVHRVEGDSEKKVVAFAVFGPKALACIKLSTLDSPTVSRCINIRMQRKKTSQKVERLRRYSGLEWQRKCLRWTKDHREQIESATAPMPEALGDREQDIFEPLFVLANLMGGDWPERIKDASLALCGESPDAANDSSVMLLGWIRTYFTETGTDTTSSAALVDWLNSREDASFSTWNDGKGIGQSDVRRLLAGFDVHPKTVRLGTKTAKGFKLDWFGDVFDSYLTGAAGEIGNTVTTPTNIDDSCGLAQVTPDQCYPPENGVPTNDNGGCYSVTAATPEPAEKHELVEADEI